MRLPRLFPLLALLIIPVALPAQPAQPVAPPIPVPGGTEMIKTFALRDAPLDLVLTQVENWTGRIVLRPQTLPAAVITLNITHPVTKDQAMIALESLLELNGIALVPLGDKFVKIVDLANANREATDLITDSAFNYPASNRIASKFYEFSFLRAQDVVQQLATFVTQRVNGLSFYASSNSILVTDTIANLQRIETLVKELDHPSIPKFKTKFYTLSYSNASDMATRIQALLGQNPALVGATNVTLSFDQRTNQLIVLGDERQFPFFNELVSQLDIKADPVTTSKVIFLKHADATVIEPKLRTLIQGNTTGAAATTNANNRRGGAAATTGTAAGTTAAQQRGAAAGNNAAAAATPAANAGVTVAGAAAGSGGVSSADFSSYLAFTSDQRSNSIIVNGTPGDVAIISGLINGLDVVLAQVRIEVVIVDVSLADGASSGISALGLQVQGNRLTGISGTAAGGTLAGAGAVTTSTSTGFASMIPGIGLLGGGRDLAGLISLTTTPRKNNASIVSAPAIVTMHNQPGSIFVGETRPVVSGSVTAGGTGGTTSTVTQLNIGITLNATPLIGADGSITLSMSTQVDGVAGSVTIDGNPQPIVSSRRTQSSVVCQSGEVLVFGGLQSNSSSKTTSRLGPIPWLGDLFGARSSDKNRSELIFFVRPIVITSDPNTEAAKITATTDRDATMKRVEKIPQVQVNDIKGFLNLPVGPAPANKSTTGSTPDAALPADKSSDTSAVQRPSH